MEDDIHILYSAAMRLLMKTEAKTHGWFFTQDEYERNVAQIWKITSAKTRLDAALRKANDVNSFVDKRKNK